MYFITPNYSVAVNPKAGSSTLARAIIAAFHPDKEEFIQSKPYPGLDGVGPHVTLTHWICPQEKEPSKPVVLIVREPVDRFRSALAQTRQTDVEAALAALEQDGEVQFLSYTGKIRKNVHFSHQHKLLNGGTAFRLENLDAAALYIGLSLPLPKINEAKRPKPALTPEQEQRVLSYYSADAALYASL